MSKSVMLLIGLLMAFFSFAQEDEWDVYIAEYEDGPGSVIYNYSAKAKAPILSQPYIFLVDLKTEQCDEYGFPKKRALQAMYDAERELETSLEGINCTEVGSFTYQCVRTSYIYLADTNDIAIIKERYQAKSDHPADFRFKEDSKWEYYLDFLYPSPEIQNYSSNKRIIEAISDAGDDLTQTRRVDHWAYFKDNATRSVFENYLEQQGFSIDKKWKEKKSDMPFAIRFYHSAIPNLDDFTSATWNLRKKAKELKGDYDGWESFVVKNKN
ncbi:MAG: DUF695 domain-containing protein [Bacteroidota bacterium]